MPLTKAYYAGAVLHTKDRDLILQQRDNKPGISNPGIISTFGGRMERGESPRATLKRELLEELDLRIDQNAPSFLGYFERFDADKEYVVACWFFELRVPAIPLVCHEGSLAVVRSQNIGPHNEYLFGPICLELIMRLRILKKI